MLIIDLPGYDSGEYEHVQMSSSVKLMACRYECGGMFVVTDRKQIPPHHLECAIKYAVAAQVQMRNKSGPIYDKWLDAMELFVTRMRP